jgi:L-malate glycosyltransferase
VARILYVSEGYSPHDRRFLDRLAESKHEIWFLPCSTNPVAYEASPVHKAVRCLPALQIGDMQPRDVYWIAGCLEFRNVVRQVKPDLIHAGPVQLGGFLAAVSGFHPSLIMSWGSDILSTPNKSPWLRRVTRFTLHRADMVLCDCAAVCRKATQLGSIPAERVVCFPWGIDLNQFRPRISSVGLRRRLGWTDCQVIVSARSLEPVHGAVECIEAMKCVLKASPNARALILGDGSLRPRIQTMIRADNLCDRFHLAGQVPEEMLADYFAEADLYVSATPCDGSSISMLEAMACGLPVVVADSEGNREWITHQVNGWLFPSDDNAALTTAMTEALDKNDLRKRMAKANVSTVRARADWNMNFPQLLAAYDELLHGDCKRENEEYAQLQNR